MHESNRLFMAECAARIVQIWWRRRKKLKQGKDVYKLDAARKLIRQKLLNVLNPKP
jgi:hypothetical protein